MIKNNFFCIIGIIKKMVMINPGTKDILRKLGSKYYKF